MALYGFYIALYNPYMAFIAFIWLLFATLLAISTKPFTIKHITFYISTLYKF